MNKKMQRQQNRISNRFSGDDGDKKYCRSVDPILTLNVPLDIDSSSSSAALGSPGSLSSISSICFLTPRSVVSSSVEGGETAQGKDYSKNLDNDDSGGDESSSSSSSSGDESDEEWEIGLRCNKLVQGERRHDNDPSSRAREAATALSLSSTLLASCHTNGEVLLWNLGQRRMIQKLITKESRSRRGSNNHVDRKDFNYCNHSRGPGLLLRRLGENEEQRRLLYQTRDPKGIVSIHDLEYPASFLDNDNYVIQQYETFSQSFCAATPCAGNPNLLALPSKQDGYVTVRDIRCDPLTSHPLSKFHGAVGSLDENIICDNNDNHFEYYNSISKQQQKHGMLTSIAMSESTQAGGRPILACGMESGTLFFHDLAMKNNQKQKTNNGHKIFQTNAKYIGELGNNCDTCGINISKDPILTLDMFPSMLPATSSAEGSVVAISGLAGDSIELAELAESDRGTVALLKATIHQHDKGHTGRQQDNKSYIGVLIPTDTEAADEAAEDIKADDASTNPNNNNGSISSTLRVRIRARFETCKISAGTKGKPGVSVCRFRPDGRIFAVGGWDKRLRIFDRVGKSNAPLAILRGHTESVNAVDWAPDAEKSGILATAAPDGSIYVWRCFS